MRDVSVMPKNEILSAIGKAKNVLIISHARPDGDCLGAAFAMRGYCLHLGKTADVVNDSPLPQSYTFIDKEGIYNKQSVSYYDTVIVVDCATNTRYISFERVIGKAKNVIWIDHHLGDPGYGNINWVDSSASSTCEMIYKLIADQFIDKDIANHLFMGISTDTGHFMHNNVTVDVMSIAVELMKQGAEASRLCTLLYKSRTLQKTRLIAKAIDEMRFYENGKIALIPLTAELLRTCGITSNETEGIIDYATAVIGVKVSVCMSEEKPNVFKVSFRARTEDVASVAEYFGGGGHRLAAGCQICGLLEDVVQKIVRVIKEVLWTE